MTDAPSERAIATTISGGHIEGVGGGDSRGIH